MFGSREWVEWSAAMEAEISRKSPKDIQEMSECEADLVDEILTYLALSSSRRGHRAADLFGDCWVHNMYTVFMIFRERRRRCLPATVDVRRELPRRWAVSTAGGWVQYPHVYNFDRISREDGSNFPPQQFIGCQPSEAPDYRGNSSRMFIRSLEGITWPGGEMDLITNFYCGSKRRGRDEWFSWRKDENHFLPDNDTFKLAPAQLAERNGPGMVPTSGEPGRVTPFTAGPVEVEQGPEDFALIALASNLVSATMVDQGALYAWASMYMWHVKFWLENAPAVIVPSTPAGIQLLLKLRDVPEGRTRRQAVGHWVGEHWRENYRDPGEEIKVRQHIRGIDTEFRWFGLNCKVCPSIEDLEKNNLLADQRAADPDTRRPRTPRERAEERRRRRRRLR